MIYLEDVIKIIGNKYLAINIAAKRARELNEKGISLLNISSRKPASVALEELIEGKIDYKELEAHVETSDDVLIFHPVADETQSAEDLENSQPSANYVDDKRMADPGEPEEGL
jgi:DNA-directed RNA polymerase omega subunit